MVSPSDTDGVIRRKKRDSVVISNIRINVTDP